MDKCVTLYCNGNYITCFPTFPNSITTLSIDPNSYNCLPNYIAAMNSTDLAVPLCAAGNSNGCAVANTTGINQLGVMNDELRIYPNPAKDVLNVECLMVNETSNLSITDILGNTIYHSTLNTQHKIISVSDLAEGVYQLNIYNSTFNISKRIVVQH